MEKPLRVLVCGCREYPDIGKVYRVLGALQNQLDEPMILMEGEARGADTYARVWAENNLPKENLLKFPADWDRYKKAAGPLRNKQMLEEGKPDLVIAFGKGRGGTNHMVRIAKEAGVGVLEFDRNED